MSKLAKEPTIPCPSCGVENRISSPFCRDCGDRIYKGGAAPTVPESAKRSARRHAVRSFFTSLACLSLVAVLGLALWPYAAVDVPAGVDRSRQVERYFAEVARLSEAGRPVPVATISQRNVNAFLGQNADPDAGKSLGALVSESRILLIANEPLGPLNLSTRLVMKPGGEGGGFTVSDFWVGHLPLPNVWATPWTQRLARKFGLEVDAERWEDVRVSRVTRSGVVVTAEPSAQ